MANNKIINQGSMLLYNKNHQNINWPKVTDILIQIKKNNKAVNYFHQAILMTSTAITTFIDSDISQNPLILCTWIKIQSNSYLVINVKIDTDVWVNGSWESLKSNEDAVKDHDVISHDFKS